MKYLSVCAGIEAASVAWHHMGWEPVAFSEIEKFPSAVLAHHYPNVPNWGDMTKFKEWPDVCRCVSDRQHELPIATNRTFNGNRSEKRPSVYPEQNSSSCGSNYSASKGTICEQCGGTNINVLVGGTPCQSFSVAGLRKGLDDPRGNLMLTYLAIADKYRPEWLVWENVPGILSSEGGRDFAALLRGLDELGYGWAYRVLDAQYFGVAQRRRRVFVVANARSWRRAAAVLFERHSLSGNPAPSRETGQNAAGTFAARSNISRNNPEHLTISFPWQQGGGQHGGLCEDYTMPLTKNQTLAMAQAIPYDLYQITAPVNRQNRKQGDPCHTLARDNAAHAAIAIQDVRAVEKAQNGRGWNDDGSAYTVDTHATQGVAVAIQGTLIGRGENAGPQGSGADVSGAMFTLTTRDVHAVAFGVGEQPVDSGHLVLSKTFSDQTDSLTAGYGKGWNGNASADNGSLFVQTTEMAVAFGGDIARSLTAWYDSNPCADRGMDVVAIGLDEEQNARVDGFGTLKARMEGGGFEGTVMTPAMQVRRLTPVECERLQGFPDGYTNIPWRNKDESPDGPRYKALGNSMAVPVMRWIGERINKVEAL